MNIIKYTSLINVFAMAKLKAITLSAGNLRTVKRACVQFSAHVGKNMN